MFAHKSRCAEHARLLTVREQYDYVVRKRASGAQGPNGLENGSDACAVVSGTRSGFDAVVMSDKKDRWSATLPAGHSRQNVLDSSGVGIAPLCRNKREKGNLFYAENHSEASKCEIVRVRALIVSLTLKTHRPVIGLARVCGGRVSRRRGWRWLHGRHKRSRCKKAFA